LPARIGTRGLIPSKKRPPLVSTGDSSCASLQPQWPYFFADFMNRTGNANRKFDHPIVLDAGKRAFVKFSARANSAADIGWGPVYRPYRKIKARRKTTEPQLNALPRQLGQDCKIAQLNFFSRSNVDIDQRSPKGYSRAV
jgi:hypothetical protein